MEKKVLEDTIEKTKVLLNASTCCAELASAAQSWLDAIGTEHEATAAKRYIEELEADIMPIDGLLGFAESQAGIQYFGEETAANIAEHAKELKANGARYCDCPACAAAEAILENKAELLK